MKTIIILFALVCVCLCAPYDDCNDNDDCKKEVTKEYETKKVKYHEKRGGHDDCDNRGRGHGGHDYKNDNCGNDYRNDNCGNNCKNDNCGNNCKNDNCGNDCKHDNCGNNCKNDYCGHDCKNNNCKGKNCHNNGGGYANGNNNNAVLGGLAGADGLQVG